MGCYKSKCRKCGEEIKGESQFPLILKQTEHEVNKHPEIHKKNRLAKEKFDKAFKKINDELIYSEEVLFGNMEWDGEDMIDEEEREKGYID